MWVGRENIDPKDNPSAAHRQWWDNNSHDYLTEHGETLGDVQFMWGPEGATEESLHVLGDLSQARVLEFGCGAHNARGHWQNWESPSSPQIFLRGCCARPVNSTSATGSTFHCSRRMFSPSLFDPVASTWHSPASAHSPSSRTSETPAANWHGFYAPEGYSPIQHPIRPVGCSQIHPHAMP